MNERDARTSMGNLGPGNTRTETTHYICDLSGNIMSVYYSLSGTTIKPPISLSQREMPIFGLNRLGVYNKLTGTSSYEITDHLGNVRAVIEKENNAPEIKSYADYYPFGEQLPSRNSLSNYRYAFQGQELDQETGMEAFQLRLWDGRIGRWLSPDPMGQYASPYLGMGNNPVSMIDPDGGFAEGPGDGFWSRLWGRLTGATINSEPVKLDEVVVQGRGTSSSSNWLSNLFDSNPYHTEAAENRNFFFNWWGSKSTQNFVEGTKKVYEAQGYIPGVDIFQSAALEKNYTKTGVQLGANLIPFGKLAAPLRPLNKVVIKGMTKLLSGELQPIMKNGVVEMLSEGGGKVSKEWLGSIHYKIDDIPNSTMNGSRILEKEINGQKVYGYIKDHNYEHVYKIATSSDLIWLQ